MCSLLDLILVELKSLCVCLLFSGEVISRLFSLSCRLFASLSVENSLLFRIISRLVEGIGIIAVNYLGLRLLGGHGRRLFGTLISLSLFILFLICKKEGIFLLTVKLGLALVSIIFIGGDLRLSCGSLGRLYGLFLNGSIVGLYVTVNYGYSLLAKRLLSLLSRLIILSLLLFSRGYSKECLTLSALLSLCLMLVVFLFVYSVVLVGRVVVDVVVVLRCLCGLFLNGSIIGLYVAVNNRICFISRGLTYLFCRSVILSSLSFSLSDNTECITLVTSVGSCILSVVLLLVCSVVLIGGVIPLALGLGLIYSILLLGSVVGVNVAVYCVILVMALSLLVLSRLLCRLVVLSLLLLSRGYSKECLTLSSLLGSVILLIELSLGRTVILIGGYGIVVLLGLCLLTALLLGSLVGHNVAVYSIVVAVRLLGLSLLLGCLLVLDSLLFCISNSKELLALCTLFSLSILSVELSLSRIVISVGKSGIVIILFLRLLLGSGVGLGIAVNYSLSLIGDSVLLGIVCHDLVGSVLTVYEGENSVLVGLRLSVFIVSILILLNKGELTSLVSVDRVGLYIGILGRNYTYRRLLVILGNEKDYLLVFLLIGLCTGKLCIVVGIAVAIIGRFLSSLDHDCRLLSLTLSSLLLLKILASLSFRRISREKLSRLFNTGVTPCGIEFLLESLSFLYGINILASERLTSRLLLCRSCKKLCRLLDTGIYALAVLGHGRTVGTLVGRFGRSLLCYRLTGSIKGVICIIERALIRSSLRSLIFSSLSFSRIKSKELCRLLDTGIYAGLGRFVGSLRGLGLSCFLFIGAASGSNRVSLSFCKRGLLGQGLELIYIYVFSVVLRHNGVLFIVSRHVGLAGRSHKIEISSVAVSAAGHS